MKRDPLEKVEFMKSVRQIWSAIFIGCAFIVLAVNIWIGMEFKPEPYIQFFLAIGSLFLVGASSDSVMKTYSAKSIKETEIKEKSKRVMNKPNDETSPDKNVILELDKKFENDPSYAPKDWVNKEEEREFR